MTSIQRFVQITAAFDPEATRTLGQAFDTACALLGHTPQPTAIREAIAKSIIEAAKAGERDPTTMQRRHAEGSLIPMCHRLSSPRDVVIPCVRSDSERQSVKSDE